MLNGVLLMRNPISAPEVSSKRQINTEEWDSLNPSFGMTKILRYLKRLVLQLH